ncbi:MAG: hypothetical protein QM642_00370 [Edaphocola sp.]
MKTKILSAISIMLLLVAAYACTKKPHEYPDEPEISLYWVDPLSISLKDTSAKVHITFKFTDGDGNIAWEESKQAIFLKSSKDTSSADYTYSYPFPVVSAAQRPSEGGLEGFATVNLGKEYFPITDSLHIALGQDTFQYRIYVMDDDSNKSNVINTGNIYVSF